MKKSLITKSAIIVIIFMAFFSIRIDSVSAHENSLTNYNGIKITEKEYNTLLNLGFTQEDIYYMDQSTYESNKDLNAKLLARTTKYLKTTYPAYGIPNTIEISKEEYENGSKMEQLRGTVTTAYKTIVSSISANGSYYRYNVATYWTNMPSNRSFDIIGIGYSDPLTITGGVAFYYRYANSQGVYTTDYTYYNKKNTSTGGAAVYHLPNGQISGLTAVLYYDVTKNTSNTITYISMCGDYAHATGNVSQSNVSDYSISIGGIGLGSSLAGLYDATPCAMSAQSVSW